MVFAFFEKLLAVLRSSSERATVAKGTASSFLIQGGFAGLSFILATVFARLLGPDGYGAYANAIAWTNVLGTFASFGFGALLVRDVAILQSQSRWGDLKGFLKYSIGFVVVFSLILMLVQIIGAQMFFNSPEKEIMRQALWIGVFLIPLSALTIVIRSALRGLEQVTRSMLPDLILRPISILVVVLFWGYLFPDSVNVFSVLLISVVVTLLTVVLSSVWFRLFLPVEVQKVMPTYQIRLWLKAAFPMLLYSGLQIFISQTSTLALGVKGSSQDVGLFSVAFRLSNLLTFFLGAVHIAMAPLMARLYANGESRRLQRILTLAVQASFFLTLLFSVFLILFSDSALAIFGIEFTQARVALIILVLANLVDAASGNPSLLLSMTGYEQTVAIIFSGIAIFNLALNFGLIPEYGFVGASWASLISLFVSRCVLTIYALKFVGINPTIFSLSHRDAD